MVPVSLAELEDLKLRDFHIARVIDEYEIDVELYFDQSSEYILRVLEFDWWKSYSASRGITQNKTDTSGNTVTAFDPLKIDKTNPDIINIHCFYTLYLIYRGLSTQLSSPYETAQRNAKLWLDEFTTYYNRVTAVSDFYDVDSDGVKDLGEVEESAYDSQRYGSRYIR